MSKLFTISILAVNKIEVTRKCLHSILIQPGEFKLVLTDNGSKDGTGAYFDELANAFPDVEVVHNEHNLGFQVPHARAFERCDTPFFVLLNNDTEVPRGWLDDLHAAFSDESVALSGPAGSCCSLTSEFHGYPGNQFEYLEGSCLMCRTEIIRKLGLWAPYLEFAYGEDSDLSLRVRKAGYRLARVPITVKHIQGVTSKSIPGVWKYQERNHTVLKKVWAHYIQRRRMDYPIVVKRKAAIGDVLLTTPIISRLAADNPLSDIFVETDFPELFLGNKDVRHADRKLKHMPDALIIDLNMAYEHRLHMPIIDAYEAVAACGETDRMLRIYPSTSDWQSAAGLLPKHGKPLCVMHVGPTTWPGKNWPQDRFGAIIEWLQEKGWNVCLIGNGSEYTARNCIDLRQRTSIMQSAAILGTAQLFVGLDSFPLHLAMAMKVPSVATFGATLPEYILSSGVAIGVTPPDGSAPCIGERHRVHGSTFTPCDGSCIKGISVNDVKEAISSLIGYS